MRKRDTWTSSEGLIHCVACGSTNTELCDARRKSGTYNRQTRCIDCGDLRTVKLPRPTDAELHDARRRSDAYSLRNPIKLASVRAWWEANAHKGYTSASGARACSIELELPINTVRGLQRDAFLGGGAAPWKVAQPPAVDYAAQAAAMQDDDDEEEDELDGVACDACTVDWAVTFQPRPLCADCAAEPAPAPSPSSAASTASDVEDEPRRDRVADAAAGRAAARQPRPPKKTRRYYLDDDGLFQPIKAGEPLHVCPTCGAQAFIHYELLGGFGVRNMGGGVLRPQSLCRACRAAHGRRARQKQLTLLDASSEQAAPPRVMAQGELDEIARRAVAALRNGEATVELVVKDDPKVALALDADTVASALYPLCPSGPLGLIVSCDHKSDTGTLSLRFDAIDLRDWAVAQGAKIITAPPTPASEPQARSAYQNPPGLTELVGGRR
jgi:hypothetical protein